MVTSASGGDPVRAYRRGMPDFEVVDSGERITGSNGMLKDAASIRKPRFTLLDMQFLTRFAAHMTKGAAKYKPNNWRTADAKDREGFQDSAARHLIQWLEGETDEDHAAAICANVMMFEATKGNVSDHAA